MEAVDFSPGQLRDEWINDFFHREGMFRVYICQLFKNGFLNIKDFTDCILEEIEAEITEKTVNSPPQTLTRVHKEALGLNFDAGTIDMVEVLAERIRAQHLHNRHSNQKRSCLNQLSIVLGAYLDGREVVVSHELVNLEETGKGAVGGV